MKVNKEVTTNVKKRSKFVQEFQEFIMRGNVIDMAVGIIIGGAFTPIVNSLVKDIIMPPIGLIWHKDFTNMYVILKNGVTAPPYASLADAQKAGAVTLNYGNFINYIITFLIVALGASRCGHCTSQLESK